MRQSRRQGPGNLLCVANFPSNVGYAWRFIEGLYSATADNLAPFGVRTWVAYPEIREAPTSLAGSVAEPIELEVRWNSAAGIFRVFRALRERNIRAIYFTDRPPWHPGYALLRIAGVRTIVVHDHTSGERTAAGGFRSMLKRLSRRFSPALADVVLAVSNYVRRRQLEVDLIPPGRVVVMLNSVDVPARVDRVGLRLLLDAPPGCAIVACACRAAEYKGVQHLLAAFDMLVRRASYPSLLVYFGDGPYMGELRRLVGSLGAREAIVLAGYRPDAAELLGGADLCVVPSVWGEAFGLAALEPAARSVAVVASRVGGLPEVVLDGETGVLVPPADSTALAEAMDFLLTHPEKRIEMGRRGRKRARELFSRRRQIEMLTRLFCDRLHVEAQ